MTIGDVDALAGLPWPEDERLEELHRRTLIPRERRLAFFYHLVRLRRPKLCLELGCLRAIVSAYMCAASDAPVVGIDLGWEHIPQHVLPELFDNFHYVVGDDREAGVVGRVEALAAEHGPLGVVWHDSSHLYGHSCEEWDAYRPLVEKEGVWVCDDLTTDMGGDPGVWRFWKERPGREKKIYWPPSAFREAAAIGVIIL